MQQKVAQSPPSVAAFKILKILRPNILLPFLVATFILMLPFILHAQTGSILFVDPADSNLDANDTLPFSIVIDVEDGEMYGSGSFTLTYDESVLKLDSFALGANLFGAINTSEAGFIRFNALSISGISGTVVLGTGQFTALANGDSALSLGIVDALADPSGNAIADVSVMNGSISVGDPTATATLTSTETVVATQTSVPTETPVATLTSVPTETPVATLTPVPTETSVATLTPVPTETPVATLTSIPTETPVATITSVPTETPVVTLTSMPTEMPVVTLTSIPTETPAPTTEPSTTEVPVETPSSVANEFVFLPIISID